MARRVRASHDRQSISRVVVGNFKSVATEQSIRIRPLTILAGANSSGKSSFMQGLLLLKQTVEAAYDPGPLLLNGSNVRITSLDQILSKCPRAGAASPLVLGLAVGEQEPVRIEFSRDKKKKLQVNRMTFPAARDFKELRLGQSNEELTRIIPARYQRMAKAYSPSAKEPRWEVRRTRCFLEAVHLSGTKNDLYYMNVPELGPGERVAWAIRQVIHLPGLRGTPERTYPLTSVGRFFPGTFDKYAASVIARWQETRDVKRLRRLGADLLEMGLTWKAAATPVNDAEVELQVGRLPRAKRGGAQDMVSIADVGFGVSQALPVLIALLVAQPGQLVFLEQPEIHLHPRAQLGLAKVLVRAANRGVRVVVETHSATLLLGLQTEVAEGRLDPKHSQLHWFERDMNTGATAVRSHVLDASGAYGKWPEDFGSVQLDAEHAYLSAVEKRAR